MTFALLLLTLTVIVVVMPLLPAIEEWRRPTDITPLPIDEADALDPTYMARRFAKRLDEALTQKQAAMGNVPLVHLPQNATWSAWPLHEKEVRTGRTERVWQTDGECNLPDRLHCLAEVASLGNMRAVANHTYRALLSRGQLTLPDRVKVIRWGHGQTVLIGDNCRLPGRVTADQAIMIGREVSFSMLHAPAIRFIGASPSDMPVTASGRWSIGRANGVLWDSDRRTGTVAQSLNIPTQRFWKGDLAVAGHLTMGEGCMGEGDIKVGGTVSMAAGCRVNGSLIAGGEIYLAAGTEVRGSVISETTVVLGPGCMIGAPGAHVTVRAPRVDISKGVVVHGTVWSGKRMMTVGVEAATGIDELGHPDLGPAVVWNEVSGRGVASESMKIEPLQGWQGDLVCQGDLELGHRCRAAGSLKAYGDLGLGAGCQVDGSIVAQGDVLVGAGAHVVGSVVSESAVVLGPGCTVGAPGKLATVCAPRIEIALGVVVHGTIWAGNSGDAMGAMQIGPDIDPDAADAIELPGKAAA